MSWLFGPRKTPADFLREQKRSLDRAIRELDRERATLQKQEQKLVADIKQMAKQQQLSAMRVMAKDLIRTRHSITKFYSLKSQLQGVSLRMQTLKSTQAMADAMRCVPFPKCAPPRGQHLARGAPCCSGCRQCSFSAGPSVPTAYVDPPPSPVASRAQWPA